MRKLKRLSIVTPIYFDSYLARSFSEKISVTKFHNAELLEVIFVVDGGDKNDELELIKIAEDFPFVKVLILSRNFGQHIALTAGYANASGNLICMINVDQQDPIDQINVLLRKMEGKDIGIIYGLRNMRHEPFLKKKSSEIFNWMLNKLTGSNTPLNVATLRIMSRDFLNAYLEIKEKSRYLPGLENWIGFEKEFVLIEQNQRELGKSSYNFKKRLKMAFETIISFSDLPLRVFTFVGIIIALIGFILIGYLIVSNFLYDDFRPGYTSTISIIVFLAGIQICVIGMASLYIGRILSEVQNRPLYIIKKRINASI